MKINGGMALPTYGCESKRMDLDTQSSDVLLLKLAGQVTLHEGRLHLKRSARTQKTQVAPVERRKLWK